MSVGAGIYQRERLSADSRTKKLLIEQLESGVLNGTESSVAVQKSHPLFQVQERNCFRNCWLSVRKENPGAFL